MTTAMTAQFPVNDRGQDYVVGDLHGCYQQLTQRLQQVGFNPDVDRLFSVGDLVDRGPESESALDYLAMPWFHAVRGNHEQMFLELYSDGEPSRAALEYVCSRMSNGMQWWLDLAQDKRRAFLEAFARLPFAIEVQTARGSVGLVHADIPKGMGWKRFLARIEARDDRTIQTAIWGRTRIKDKDTSGVAGIDRVFVGHTIQTRTRRLGNIYYIDSGAFIAEIGRLDAGLTVVHLMAHSAALSDGHWEDSKLFEPVHGRRFSTFTESAPST